MKAFDGGNFVKTTERCEQKENDFSAVRHHVILPPIFGQSNLPQKDAS